MTATEAQLAAARGERPPNAIVDGHVRLAINWVHRTYPDVTEDEKAGYLALYLMGFQDGMDLMCGHEERIQVAPGSVWDTPSPTLRSIAPGDTDDGA